MKPLKNTIDKVVPWGRSLDEYTRIFPILHMDGSPSAHFDYVLETLPTHGLAATVERVPYEYQRGGNKMLRVRRA